MTLARPDAAFWRGKRVLLTGHTGFKGAWLALWLQRLGARVTGLALAPATQPSLFELAGISQGLDHHVADIRDAAAVARVVQIARPEIVLHLAAQALVRESYREPVATWSSNVMGTVHVLDALRLHPGARVAVCVTTDKVYRNREWHHPYRESDELGGHDPYSASKAACELAIASYRDAFLAEHGLALASARAGNVIGGGDWAADRLLPDVVRAWQRGETVQIRRPEATRPWQHVIEPLAGYLCLVQALWQDATQAGAWNFGPLAHERATVRQVVDLARGAWGSGAVEYAPQTEGPHEASWLALDTSRVQAQLALQPRWDLEQSVLRTLRWYRAQHEGADARALCLRDLEAWEARG
ncbi:MAG: CDP-glucose 4,6-dehydratase [Hylemonella sp.]|uniref:CDP-glucose 4,6-dehydratase n=1 Tax=Hylemonella sp. TaxID=2066020 RepID=UPI00391C33C8